VRCLLLSAEYFFEGRGLVNDFHFNLSKNKLKSKPLKIIYVLCMKFDFKEFLIYSKSYRSVSENVGLTIPPSP
jgi:hypothetical protein